jgi:tetratricopeptide (TPR) repeat protein
MNRLLLLLAWVCCFTLATLLAPVFQAIHTKQSPAGNALLVLVGDSRRLFASQFFTMADVYFHSGYYPTIFDATKKEGPTHLDVASRDEDHNSTNAPSGARVPDDDDNFLGRPKDWIDAFGRNFFPSTHTHLTGANSREILPWLKLSAELDPNRIVTYVTAAYWLRTSLNRPAEAEAFLRQGLRANPDSPEILLELGRVFLYNKNDARVGHNIFDLALQKWIKLNLAQKDPDPHVHEEILGEMVRADEKTGDLKQLLADLEALDKISHSKPTIEKYIQDTKAKLAR